MATFSKTSKKRLETCDNRLQLILNDVIKVADCTILCGHRNQSDQQKAFETGRSKVQYPNGKHNSYPSMAVDVAPYPIDWNDVERFHVFADVMFAIAKKHNVRLRYGGDWDMDGDTTDQTFNDLPHYEVLDE